MTESAPLDYYHQLRDRQRNEAENDPVAATIGAMRRERVQRDILQGSEVPDAVARTSRLAREVGVAPGMLDGRVDEVERMRNARRLGDLAERYPAIGKWALNNPRAAAAAQDDADNLGLLARAWDTVRKAPARAVGVGGYRFAHGVTAGWNMLEEGLDTVMAPVHAGMGAVADATGLDVLDPQTALKANARRRQQNSAAMRRRETSVRERNAGVGFVEESILSGFDSTATSVAAVVAGTLTRNPGVSASLFASTTAAPGYAEARKR